MRQEVRDYIRTGSLQSTTSSKKQQQQQMLQKPNITFMMAPSMQYNVYFSCSIFRAVELAPSSPGCTTAAQRVLATVSRQLAAVVGAIQAGRLTVQLVHGDILEIATAAADGGVAAAAAAGGGSEGVRASEPQALFDYIDTSNVSDYTSVHI